MGGAQVDAGRRGARVSAMPRLSSTRERVSRARVSLGAHPMTEGAIIAILVILSVAALRLASALLVPVAISLLLSVLFATPVRWMNKIGMPAAAGAAIVVFGAVALIGAGAAGLARPAADWLHDAPSRLPDIEAKIRTLLRPINAIERTAQQVQQAATPAAAEPTQQVTVRAPGLMTRVSGSTGNAIAAILTVLFLTYFFSASEPMFAQKIAGIIPESFTQGRVLHVLTEIQRQTSHYLWITTLISLGVGCATWAVLAIVHLPNAALWGAVAALLNFIPYVGTVVSTVLIGAAALLTFDGVEKTVIVLIAYSAIHVISGYIVTPIWLGRRLPLNQVALFLGLVFWTWVWGAAGAILAVPLTVMAKVVCDHVPRLRPMAVLLDN